jgi:mannonate dehydratase
VRVGFGQFKQTRAEFLQFAQQYGATDVLLNRADIPSRNGTWELMELVKLRLEVEQYGLRLGALENVPIQFFDQIMMGGPDRERQIENMITTIRNIARAGIPVFGYGWAPSRVWRTTPATIRGGAVATAFNYEMVKDAPLVYGREHTEEEMWERLEEWIRIITPIAEEEGIRLGVHPADPPVPKLGGVPQLMRSFDSYKRLIEIVDSPANSVEFCQGSFAEMEDGKGEGIYQMIEYFASRDRIVYVHFRNVSTTVPNFNEEFVNTGYVDMYRAMKIYHRCGYKGFFIDDHVPRTLGDTRWGHQGRAFANGYIQGLIEAVTKEGSGGS